MKKILLTTLLLIPFIGFSQTTKPIDGFLGIKFGSGKLAVITAMKARGSNLVANKKDELIFNNVKLGKDRAKVLFVRFVNNKAYDADFYFVPDVSGHALAMYNGFVNDFTGVYGAGQSIKNYTSPYNADDTSTLELGLLVGKVDYHTDFTDSNTNYIEIGLTPINSQLEIEISYVDNTLADQADKAHDQQNKSDL
ncbi:MAG: hypothetical protein ACTHNW_18775 [Mucilaginibacter sp.]